MQYINNLKNFLKFLLQFSSYYGIIFLGHMINVCAAMAQSVERHLGKVEVTGSIPVGSLIVKSRLSRHFESLFFWLFSMTISMICIT